MNFTTFSDTLYKTAKGKIDFSDNPVIMIVDDCIEDTIFASEKIKALTNWQVMTANKIGNVGLLSNIDFALIDFNLNNGMEGDRLGSALRKLNIPYAYLSGAEEPGHCKDKNATWLKKSISGDKLVETIKDFLKK